MCERTVCIYNVYGHLIVYASTPDERIYKKWKTLAVSQEKR